MKKIVIIPTYEEASNIGPLLYQVNKLSLEGLDILVIDDSFSDKTAQAVKEEQRKHQNILLKKRNKKRGIANAYIEGFRYALRCEYELIIQMDADFSHEPRKLPELIKMSQDYDFVVGSRYIRRGRIENWNIFRRVISLAGNYGSKKFLSAPINDLTGGFNIWHSYVLRKLDLDAIRSKGYFFQIEIKYLSVKNGFSFVEAPITFKERKEGDSKFRLGIIWEALRQLVNIKTKK